MAPQTAKTTILRAVSQAAWSQTRSHNNLRAVSQAARDEKKEVDR